MWHSRSAWQSPKVPLPHKFEKPYLIIIELTMAIFMMELSYYCSFVDHTSKLQPEVKIAIQHELLVVRKIRCICEKSEFLLKFKC